MKPLTKLQVAIQRAFDEYAKETGACYSYALFDIDYRGAGEPGNAGYQVEFCQYAGSWRKVYFDLRNLNDFCKYVEEKETKNENQQT